MLLILKFPFSFRKRFVLIAVSRFRIGILAFFGVQEHEQGIRTLKQEH